MRNHLKFIPPGVPAQKMDAPVVAYESRAMQGSVTWKGSRVSHIEVPSDETPEGRVIRAHELLHAHHTKTKRPLKLPAFVDDIVEDLFIHCYWWPRHNLAHLYEDLRFTAHHIATVNLKGASKVTLGSLSPAQWEQYVALRLRHLGLSKTIKGFEQSFCELPQGVHRNRFNVLLREIELVASRRPTPRNFRRLARLVLSLLSSPPTYCPGVDEMPDEPHQIPGEDGMEPLLAPPMRIVELPLVAPCETDMPTRVPARSGPVLNVSRLPRLVTDFSTTGLFRKRRRIGSQGTFLFDASGSMGITQDRLSELCAQVPGARIAYYVGYNSRQADHCWGQLYIYARDGIRADQTPRCGGENQIDLYAIQWLLEQPGPRIMVTDWGFYGGPQDQGKNAKLLLHSSIEAGDITLYESFHKFRQTLRSS